MKHRFTILLFIFSFSVATAQNQYSTLFLQVANTFGESKPIPKLEIIPKNQRCKVPAQYLPSKGIIEIEECLIDITKKLGKDSTNALAIIMGHELAHYYKGHEWCSEFAYSVKNTDLGKKLINISKDQRKINESQADDLGFYAVSMAGYQPFDIYPKLIDSIYDYYQLPHQIEGYPSKEDRKAIAREAERKISKLYAVFLTGNFLSHIGAYKEASMSYEYLLKYFPSRENFNNWGVAKLQYVLSQQDNMSFPFILPIETDPLTRLVTKSTLRSSFGMDNELETLLEQAKEHFNEAVKKDKSYTDAYINGAICFLLQENYEGALGKINELVMIDKKLSDKALIVKAIAYYLNQQQSKAIGVLNQIQNQDEAFTYNTEIIKKGYAFFEAKLPLIEWQKNRLSTLKSSSPSPKHTISNQPVPTFNNWVEINKDQKIGYNWFNDTLQMVISTQQEGTWSVSIKNADNGTKSNKSVAEIIEKISPQQTRIYTFSKIK